MPKTRSSLAFELLLQSESDDQQSRSNSQHGYIESSLVKPQTLHRPAEYRDQEAEGGSRQLERTQHELPLIAQPDFASDNRGQAARGDSVHGLQISVFGPKLIVSQHSGERSNHHKNAEQHNQHGFLSGPFAEQRKENVKQFLHGERPEHVPGGGQVPGAGLKPVDG